MVFYLLTRKCSNRRASTHSTKTNLYSCSIYSSHEHSLLPTTASATALPVSRSPLAYIIPTTTLPLDIILETLFATFLLILAIVYSAPPLRPIRWNEWAGKIEREGWDPAAEDRNDEAFRAKGGAANVYRAMEERKGFYDVRKSRQDFAKFVRAE